MHVLLRATLVTALAAPLAFALPADATTGTTTLAPIPRTWHQHFGAVKTAGPREVFARLRARVKTPPTHFNFPYALATDKAGNLFVANANDNIVKEVTPAYKVLAGGISQGLSTPFSIAVDSAENIYVGNLTGNVAKFSSNGTPLATISANATYPAGIAVDDFQDLFITTAGGVAVDDVTGATIWTDIYSPGQQLFSVAIGGPNVFTFYAGTVAEGNGSVALRDDTLQYLVGPLQETAAVGSACTAAACWFDDANADTLGYATFPGTSTTVAIPYSPAGMAYDSTRNRLFVADPTHESVHVYDATTFALEKTIL